MDLSSSASVERVRNESNEMHVTSDSISVENSLKRKLESVENEVSRVAKHGRKGSRNENDLRLEEAEYYMEKGLRKVYPYYFTYTTFCKGRWVGEQLLRVFCREFRAYPEHFYARNIDSGMLKVNDEIVDINYVLKDYDRITNSVHRHETAVIASSIKIILKNDDILVIDKPPSIPVHPCGKYRHNTVLFILAKEHNLKELHTVHRLDRLTSGLLLFCRNLKTAQMLDTEIRERKVSKEYVCRVEGNFPDEIVTCNKPISVLSPKIGVCIVSSKGKECSTIFEKLSYNGKSSVVICKPLTGRMHQIRVHLQYLGYPIINDPIYNNVVFGPQKGKHGETGKSEECLLADLMSIHNSGKWLLCDLKEKEDLDSNVTAGNEETQASECIMQSEAEDSFLNDVSLKALSVYAESSEAKKLADEYLKVLEKFKTDPYCELCKQKYKDPEPKDLIMYLHALKYTGSDWEYKTDMPVWANSDWNLM